MPGLSGGRRRLSMRQATPTQIAVLVLGAYAAFVVAYLAAGHDVRDFIRIGPSQIAQGHGRSREIRLDRGYRPPGNQDPSARGQGYDGQFSYYIALDPVRARAYLDVPSYRYSRILYPMLARALALGSREALPWILVLINLLAIGGGTWALALLLRRSRVSPYWALIYGLWPGMLIALQRDLTEPLAYGLVAGGLLAMDGRERWRLPAAGVIFGLAGLTRQTTLVFPIVLGLWLLTGQEASDPSGVDGARRWPSALGFLALSLAPYAAYWIFLRLWLGTVSDGGNLTLVPFGGIVHPPYHLSRQGIEIVFIVLPALVALWTMLPRTRTVKHAPGPRGWGPWLPWFLLVANVLVNVVFYARSYADSYTGASRQAIGIVVAALLCLPHAARLASGGRRSLLLAAGVAMIMLPIVVAYGFTNVSA